MSQPSGQPGPVVRATIGALAAACVFLAASFVCAVSVFVVVVIWIAGGHVPVVLTVLMIASAGSAFGALVIGGASIFRGAFAIIRRLFGPPPEPTVQNVIDAD